MKVSIEWDESMSTGIAELDEEHKEFIRYLNTLSDAIQRGEGERTVENILDFLEQYIKTHFNKEEKCMIKHKCPTAAANKEAHQNFINIFSNLREGPKKEYTRSSVAYSVYYQLSEWFINHICKVDRQLYSCIAKKTKSNYK